MNLLQSVIIAIVEGLTEFLPISSTGHIIITERVLGTTQSAFSTSYTVAVQLGAIMAVVALYWRKFFNFSHWQFYVKLMVGVIPAVVLGLSLEERIDALLESTTTVAIALLAGGVVLIFIDKFFNHPTITSERGVSYGKSFLIGLWQCLALVPGVSRSASSIIGGMQQKLTRSAAAEFSFFLGVPTLAGAALYKMYKYYQETGGFTGEEIKILTIGNVVSFLVAMMAIRFFINFLKKHGFRLWGFYRVVLGTLLLVLIYSGYLQG